MAQSVRARIIELREGNKEVSENALGTIGKRKAILEKHKKNGEFEKPMTGGQLPDLIFVSNLPSLDLSHALYGDFPPIESKCLTGGVFGQASIVDSETDVRTWVDDYAQFAYMMNHLEHAGKKIPFLMFLGEDSSRGIYLIENRKRKFIEDLKKSGRVFDEQTRRIISKFGNEVVKTPVLVVVFNRQRKKFYVIDQHRNKVPFEEYLSGIETPNDTLKRKIIDKMRSYEESGAETGAIDILSIACCDARSFGFGDEQRIKTLGALLSKERLGILMKDKFSRGDLIFELHTGCGYITAAVQFYEMIRELQVKAETREDLYIKIKSAVNNPEVAVNLSEAHARGLDKKKQELFAALFSTSTADFRKILFHMIRHLELFKLDDSRKVITMPAFDRVVRTMEENGYAYSQAVKIYLITEELLATQLKDMAILSGKIKTTVDLNVYPTILSFADYARYNLPLTEENGLKTIAQTEKRVDGEEEKLFRVNEFGEMKNIPEILGL